MKILPRLQKLHRCLSPFAKHINTQSQCLEFAATPTQSFYPSGNQGMALRVYELIKGIEKYSGVDKEWLQNKKIQRNLKIIS